MWKDRRNKLIDYIKKNIKTQMKYIVLYNILNISLTIILLGIPLIQGRMLDILIYSKNQTEFMFWVICILLQLLFQIFIRFFSSKLEIVKTSSFGLNFNKKILDYLFGCHTNQVLKYEPTYFHSRILQDTEAVINFYFKTISSFLNNILVLTFAIVILGKVNTYILISLVIFFPVYTFIYILFKRKIRITQREQMEASNACFSARNMIYMNYLEEKALRRDISAKDKLAEKEHILLNSINKMFQVQFSLNTIQVIVNSIFHFGGFALGGLAVLKGQVTLGVFSYVLQYFSMLLNTVEEFLNIGTSFQTYRASLHRLEEVFQLEQENNGKIVVECIERIELKNVNYRYKEDDNYLYRNNLSLQFEAGNFYTIKGENGVGKTTLFMIIAGVLKDDGLNGKLYINNVEYSEMDMCKLREQDISIVLQQAYMYDGSVSEYIFSILSEVEYVSAKKNKDFKEVFESRYFNLDNIQNCLFDNLSGGEKQMVNLFIGLAKNASLYLLDEATANVFLPLKEKIYRLIQKKVFEGNIVIRISHEPDCLANEIIVEI